MAPSSDEEDVPGELRFRGTRKRDLDFLAKNGKRNGVKETSSGLQYKVRLANPEGRRPNESTPCRVAYRGILTDGTEFDSTYRKGMPIVLRPDQVVPGWCEAMQMMREGEKWEVVLPSHLAYGEQGAGPIPGGAVLIFEMELLEVGSKPGDGWPFNPVLAIGGLIALALLIFVYQQFFWRTQNLPRGPIISLKEASNSPRNVHVFLDVEVDGEKAGRIELELFKDVAPLTVENFRALATGEKGIGHSGKPLHFKGSKFHRIIPQFMVQGGDFTNGDGRGGESIYGATFRDEWEHAVVQHSEPGLLSMANRGASTNGSQFFITLAPASWLDHKHVVFGRVVHGMDVLKLMEGVGTKSGIPKKKVVITDSGELGLDGKPQPASPESEEGL
eukprot:TRINITY_DN70900_c0_g1_i1.p1 TRINITY_DN70900_c0_g1~~TRINITY_DN70900_c0_g1_i1.p1  ORF type:complete len:416 (+),score=62.50 TRINITY_DN70900_c0_g1_i1:86-1249(+)